MSPELRDDLLALLEAEESQDRDFIQAVLCIIAALLTHCVATHL